MATRPSYGALCGEWAARAAGNAQRTWRAAWTGAWAAAADVLFPPNCLTCDAPLDEDEQPAFCKGCLKKLLAAESAACGRCGMTVPDFRDLAADCGQCRRRKPKFQQVARLGRYQEFLREAVLRTKFPWEEPTTAGLTELLWRRSQARLIGWRCDVTAPVPMHWRRRWSRGANAPDAAAEVLAGRLRIPCEPRMLVRLRDTAPQGPLGRKARRDNVHSAFAVRQGFDPTGAHVLLVDDILTTGATADAACSALLSAGASQVSVAVLARAEGIV